MTQGPTKGIPIDTDSTLAANSDQIVASQKATKAYVSAVVASASGGVTSGGAFLDLTEQNSAPATPSTSHARLYAITGGQFEIKNATGARYPIALHPSWTAHRYIQDGAGAPTFIGGFFNGAGVSAGTISRITGPDGAASQYAQTTANTNVNLVVGPGYPLALRALLIAKFGIFRGGAGYANLRAFAGFIDTATAGITNDNPGTQCVGIQFSASRGDTYWQYVTHNGTSWATPVASTVAPSEDVRYLVLDVVAGGTALTAYILDHNFVILDSHGFASGLPATSTSLYLAAGARQTSVNTLQLRVFDQTMYYRGSE